MSPRGRRSVERAVIISALTVLGAAFAAAPTGLRLADVLWSAGLVGLLAGFGATASPLLLLPAGAATALLMGGGVHVALAAGAVLAAGWSATQARPSSRLGALSGGLVGLALLGRGDLPVVVSIVGAVAVAAAIVGGGLAGLPRRRRRRARLGLAAFAAAVVLLAAAGLIAGLRARGATLDGVDALRAARASATSGDLDAAVDGFREGERSFRSASEPLEGFGRLGLLVPGLAQQLDAARTAVDTAADAAGTMREISGSIHLDDVGVTDGTLDLAALSATEAPLGQAVDVLVRSVRDLGAVDRGSLLPPIRDALDDALDEARAAATTADHAHRAAKLLPPLLGQGQPTRFLVLFTSPVEARNRLGFPGAYAVLRFAGGHLSVERAGPMTDLDPPNGFDQSRLSIPARAAAWVPYGVTRQWRSVTFPSDAPTVADLAMQLAAQVGLGQLDGVAFADPAALAEIVGLVGDVRVPGIDVTLTRDTTEEFLLRDQYLKYPQLGQQRDRKDALGLVAAAVGSRLGSLTLGSVEDLSDRFGPLVAGGHLVITVPSATRAEAATLLGELDVDGAFPRQVLSDVLYVGQSNNVGNKIDAFLHRTIAYDAEVDRDGKVTAQLTIDLTNEAPASGLPEYVIGAALNPPPPKGTNLTTALIYSRHRLASLTVDGVPLTPSAFPDGGLVVYQVPVELGPGQHKQIVATLEGEARTDPYDLVAYRSSLPNPDAVEVLVHDARTGGTASWSGAPDAPTCLTTAGKGGTCDAARVP